MALSDEVKASVSLVEFAGQSVAWDQHKSVPAQGDWWAPCPFHGEATASFHVTEPKGKGGTFYCFGCQEKGSVIDFLMARDGMSFADAVRKLADYGAVGLKPDPERAAKVKAEAEARQRDAEAAQADRAERGLSAARDIWAECRKNAPQLIEYLTGRGVRLAAIGGLPPSLRFHPDLPARDGRGNIIHRGPAMVAFVGRDRMLGIHRTWIDGPQRARLPGGAKVPKQMLGATGAMFGAPTMLTKPGGSFLIVGEGIETTLAALSAIMMVKGGPRPSAEAALSLGALSGPADNHGRRNLLGRAGKALPSARPLIATDKPGWLPPTGTRRTIILADPSTRCPDTARLHGERALAKIGPHCRDGARLCIPRGHWDHDDDFADLAKLGELYD